MTIDGEQILAALRRAWPDVDLHREPSRLTGGYWAVIWRLCLTGTPPGIPGDLVLRVVPDAAMGAKEIAVQSAAAQSGVPTPRVHLTGPAGGPLSGAWVVMDLAIGAPLLAGLDSASALRRLPRLAGTLPRQLADTMALVHRVDPTPVTARVRDAAPPVAFTVDELWPHLRASAAVTGRRDLADSLEHLVAGQPPQGDAVICHGDLHPFNLLTDGTCTTVLDWTAAIAAPAAYDVALTWLLLRHPPLVASPGLRPVIDVAAAALARRFVHLYRRANPVADLTGLHWYAGLHALRILIDHATWARNGDPRVRNHPWRLVAPGATKTLRRASRASAGEDRVSGRVTGPGHEVTGEAIDQGGVR